MKVFLNDNGPVKEPSRGRKSSQPREKRSGGFKRKQTARAKDIDELLESGTDTEETLGGAEVEEAPEPAPARKGRGSSLRRKSATPEPEPESVEPEEEPGPEPEEEPETPAPKRAMQTGKKSSTAKITVSAPDAAEPKAKRGKPPKPPKPEKQSKGFGRKKVQEEPEEETVMPKSMKVGKQPKPPRPTSGPKQPKQPKASRKPKVQAEDDFAENMAPQGPVVLVKPESVGSQLLSLIEVIAGGCIAFFGATQVGNILINKIVSMM